MNFFKRTQLNLRNFSIFYTTEKDCRLYDLGKKEYCEIWKYQKKMQNSIYQNNEPNTILFVEHFDVYTLGRGASLDNVKFDLNDKRYNIYRIERGGEVTYHNPGQLVIYPILNLKYFKKDLHWYLRQVLIYNFRLKKWLLECY